MSKSLIQTANTSAQTLAADGIIDPGRVLRRYGNNLCLNGNAIEADGAGYYKVNASITARSTAAGDVSVTLLENGVAVPGAAATGTAAAAGDAVALPIVSTVRLGCNCDGGSALTLAVSAAGTVSNVSWQVEKS